MWFIKIPDKGPIGIICLALMVAFIILAHLYMRDDEPNSEHKYTREDLARLRLILISAGLWQYHSDHSAYPPSLSYLLQNRNDDKPYIDSVHLSDPWGTAMMYSCPSTRSGNPYDLYSCGPNCRDNRGGSDDMSRDGPLLPGR